ncbi:MAG: hypothetical protein AAFY64_04835 [Pseudomonadota bacterium]
MTSSRLTLACVGTAIVALAAISMTGLAPAHWMAERTASQAERELVAIDLHERAIRTGAVDARRLKRSSIHSHDGASVPRNSVRIGDRITIADKRGLKRVFEVVSLRRTQLTSEPYHSSSQSGGLDENFGSSAFVIVTARDIEDEAASPVRFLIDDIGEAGTRSSALETPRPQTL